MKVKENKDEEAGEKAKKEENVLEGAANEVIT